jgi:hypothetical protein
MLAEYEGKEFDEIQFRKEIQDYIKKLQPKWQKIEKSVFRALKEIVKNEWQEKEIKCYVVKYCKYINWVELQVLRKLFNQKFVKKILKKVLSVRGGKIWDIVLTKENNLTHLFQIADKK